MRKIKLFAENDLPIIGIKLIDGSISDFEYSYDDQTKTGFYLLPDGNKFDQDSILVDSSGNEWNMVDVEYYSIFEKK